MWVVVAGVLGPRWVECRSRRSLVGDSVLRAVAGRCGLVRLFPLHCAAFRCRAARPGGSLLRVVEVRVRVVAPLVRVVEVLVRVVAALVRAVVAGVLGLFWVECRIYNHF